MEIESSRNRILVLPTIEIVESKIETLADIDTYLQAVAAEMLDTHPAEQINFPRNYKPLTERALFDEVDKIDESDVLLFESFGYMGLSVIRTAVNPRYFGLIIGTDEGLLASKFAVYASLDYHNRLGARITSKVAKRHPGNVASFFITRQPNAYG